MRIGTITFAGIAVLLLAFGPVHAEVPLGGTLTATEACPAYQSFRKSTNPGDVKIETGKAYGLVAKNKPDATHYRIIVDGAQPAERWVALSCGRVDEADGVPRGDAKSGGGGGQSLATGAATHVLAMSWQPAFCARRKDKKECGELTSASPAASRLSLHGLWPQPRSKSYCNVAPAVREADHARNWGVLPEPEISEATRTRLADVMPGVQSNLHRHEWIVHGTCYAGTAEAYFAKSVELAEAVNASKVPQLFAENAGRSLTAEAIRAAFDEAFGAGTGERVAVSCQGRGEDRKIQELTIGLAGDVTGAGSLGDLMRAAKPAKVGCPGGLVEHVQ